MILIYACNGTERGSVQIREARLLHVKKLNYPSGSTVNFYKDRLYLMGDDAPDMLILDTCFVIKKRVPIFSSETQRIIKRIKPDIEAGDFIQAADGASLWLFGSGSVKPHRDSLFVYNTSTRQIRRKDISVLYDQIEQLGAQGLNIEAAALVRQKMLLGHRAVALKPNYLISIPYRSLNLQTATPKLIAVKQPETTAGISGMAYDGVNDRLFLTFSTEDTANSYSDGETGDSFLALIDNISAKYESDSLSIDAWLPLASVDASFKKMKIESVAITRYAAKEYHLILVADNDDGNTIVYKLWISL